MSSYQNNKMVDNDMYFEEVIDDKLFDEYEDDVIDRDYMTEEELDDLGLGDAYRDSES